MMRKMTTLAGLMMTLSVGIMSGTALAATADVTIDGTVVRPTCTLSTPATHSLGTMTSGKETSYAEMKVKVLCNNGAVSSRLYVGVQSGTVSGSTAVKMNGTGSVASNNPPLLQLLNVLNQNNPVILNGSGSTSDSATFCSGTTTRDCNLKPKVDVPYDAATGAAKASLRFTLRYS